MPASELIIAPVGGGRTFTGVFPGATRRHQWPRVAGAIQQEQRVEVPVFHPAQSIRYDWKVVPTGRATARPA